MSDRKTSSWTENLADAFVNSDATSKGVSGELFTKAAFDSWGWNSILHQESRVMQIQGKDISFNPTGHTEWYTADIKCNLNDSGMFFVYKNWLMKVKCDYIIHVNPDAGLLICYDVDDMRVAYEPDKEYMKYHVSTIPEFMTKARVKL